MAETTIEWTDATWNSTTGCTRASAGCDHCYAFTMTKRLAAMGQKKYQGLVGNGHFNGVLRTWPDELSKPLAWKKPRMIFVNSMSDLFHDEVPLEFIDKVFAVMALCPQHTFQVLTKRADRMAAYFADLPRRVFDWDNGEGETEEFLISGLHDDDETEGILFDRCDEWLKFFNARNMGWPLSNVWLGVSVENQMHANRIDNLLECPAAVRFVSFEPLLGPVMYPLDGIHWAIIGGESGPHARPCDVAWIRSLKDQCVAAGEPVFVKQLGANILDRNSTSASSFPERMCWPEGFRQDVQRIILRDPKGGDPAEWPKDLRVREFPKVSVPL